LEQNITPMTALSAILTFVKKIFSVLIILISVHLANGQTLDSLNQAKFNALVTTTVKAENDSLFDKAIALIDSAIALDNDRDFTFVIKSEVLWMQKRYAEAAENYKRAIWLNKDTSFFFGAYLVLGILFEKSNQLEEAKANYLKAVNLFEAKKLLDRFYPNIDKEDYAVALCLSKNKAKWERLLKEPSYADLLRKYLGKSRREVLNIYFQKFGG
jgi:tetratricopeptide (TPR) repeat protein